MKYILDQSKSKLSSVLLSTVGRYPNLSIMVDINVLEEIKSCIKSDDTKDLIRPHLRPSIFPNVPPFINFLNMNQKYKKFVNLDIPWNLWTGCHNTLLIHCMVRAGFQAKQVI